ncbi:TIGR00730 family Rossman fold protein [Haematospirillum jordaniae]|uniref:Cytokinin riboside 5'-monophosphate phosphoribohydrolase n=1 Tax=Haematospirillum jordaniae TaxID=1549855 RepID=A0A143DD64_9PROT|nr:TIGR00730 family Rossman fold protein [Haematospirillum jordaniae]AMW34058.1 lysine decarboxylase [Haematospirillum jordaniae]NKD45310.1 TIGR00730 family Rossman fold protein [Haematospirillum jordaniae]NKD57302.1 TIGR00730 family Rossman fold protein [Haematospirillum jordaniae]NKD59656.1 TIGR00730 family Rossman fold protein [Haematospirillum jordaniae]NKD67228.1 TIGR00730 family Rossman fold protein [Haematospirillum jordaniae]
MSLLQSSLHALCVFCGSSFGSSPRYADAASRLGTLLGENGIRLVYGGGAVGLMGTVAKACLEAGGKVTGIIPQHLASAEVAMEGLTELIVVPDMHTRKRMMFERSDAFAVLPGGFGTMDETFEILTWKQLKLHDRPVVIADIGGYWTPFLRFNESMAAEGFVRPEGLELYSVVSNVDDVLPAARSNLDLASRVHERVGLF